MLMGGFCGKVLCEKLTSKTYSIEVPADDAAQKHLGEAGLGSRDLFQETSVGVDALGPDNKLVFKAGESKGQCMPILEKQGIKAS